MDGAANEDPTGSSRARVHHLTHLVNAITNELSACLSLDSLLKQCVRGTNTSRSMVERAEIYHTSLNLCRKSLATFAHYVKIQLGISPGSQEPGLEPGVEGHSQIVGAYDSLKTAARECTKVPALLRRIEDRQTELDTRHRSRQWQGWPSCYALEELQDLNQTLMALRDSGGNSDVGWSVTWRDLVDVGIWLELDGQTWRAKINSR